MSTKITDVYDQIASVISTALSAYTRLPNPYILDENSELFMSKGFAVGVGPGQNTERHVGCFTSIRRSFQFALMNKVVTTETNLTSLAAQEKALMEDQFLVIKALEKDPNLNASASSCKYASDSGIEFIEGERGKYFLVTTELTVEYFEQL